MSNFSFCFPQNRPRLSDTILHMSRSDTSPCVLRQTDPIYLLLPPLYRHKKDTLCKGQQLELLPASVIYLFGVKCRPKVTKEKGNRRE